MDLDAIKSSFVGNPLLPFVLGGCFGFGLGPALRFFGRLIHDISRLSYIFTKRRF